jgi:hypothetical protein
MIIETNPATDLVGESALATTGVPKIEMMTVITVGGAVREITEAGEMIPATGLGDGQTILLT